VETEGEDTGWVVRNPDEIVAYVLFDPSSVEDRLPSSQRFITVGELAGRGVDWASTHLANEPDHVNWGISFIEMVRADVFTIDGRDPDWPANGAVALWAARVTPSDPRMAVGSGKPLLMLDFWLSDARYIAYMAERGYFGSYGDVRLYRDSSGTWVGSLVADDLSVRAACRPFGPTVGGEGSFVRQVLIPPRTSHSARMVQVNLSGHRIQECDSGSTWEFAGTHPLISGAVVGESTYQFGYELDGSVLDQ
jgi:hypothetical protein